MMLLQYAAAYIFYAAVIFCLAIYGGFYMSIPILYRNEKYFIVDRNTLELYDLMFAGFIFIGGVRYKKYQAYDKKLLLEV